METIKLYIKQQNPDAVRIKYYPASLSERSDSLISIRNIECDKSLNTMINNRIKINKMKEEKDAYTELGLKDTFMKIHSDGTYEVFRRRQYMLTDIPDIFNGFIIIEFITVCDHECFPHIVSHTHDISCDMTIYRFNKFRYTYSRIKNNACVKSQSQSQRRPFSSHIDENPQITEPLDDQKEEVLFDISSLIDIKNVDKSIDDFLDHINELNVESLKFCEN